MTHQLPKDNADPNDREIRDYLRGHLCRCVAYPEILRAVKSAARILRAQTAQANI